MVIAILQITKGVARVPGDTLSSETGLDSIDLLDPSGFSCDDYVMEIPSLKSGATWADSPITDGRTLVSGAFGNVKETIHLNLTASTLIQMAAMLSKLAKMRLDANNFWDEFGQIEPVYLKHQIEGEPGPRYALLYDIDIAVKPPIDPGDPNREVTLVIERELYWRGLAPGDNPKHWFYYINAQSQQWVSANVSLLAGTDHLYYDDQVSNQAGLSTGALGYLSRNFIDIPAAKIAGDAPALLSLSIAPAGASAAPTSLLVGKTTRKTTGNLNRTTGINQTSILTFNMADAGVNTDTTLANDAGASNPIGGGTAQRSQTTFVTATMATRVHFSGNEYATGLSLSMLRGRYAVFLRARVSAAAVVNLQLNIVQAGGGNTLSLSPVALSDLGGGGTGNTTDWALVSLGQLTLPINKRTDVSGSGNGVYVQSGSANTTINIQASRTSGAGVLYMNDLILMPIDEGVIRISGSVLVNTSRSWNYDNTGYYTHGTQDDIAECLSNISNEFDLPELSGSLMLTPGVANRLMFLSYVESTKRSYQDDPTNFAVRVNIVPRWAGLRNV